MIRNLNWNPESPLPGFQLTYHTAGTLNERGDNVIWVCHALTANSDVSEWWTGLYGKGKPLNPEKALHRMRQYTWLMLWIDWRPFY